MTGVILPLSGKTTLGTLFRECFCVLLVNISLWVEHSPSVSSFIDIVVFIASFSVKLLFPLVVFPSISCAVKRGWGRKGSLCGVVFPLRFKLVQWDMQYFAAVIGFLQNIWLLAVITFQSALNSPKRLSFHLSYRLNKQLPQIIPRCELWCFVFYLFPPKISSISFFFKRN